MVVSPAAVLGVAQILGGCCVNVISLEFIVRYDPNAGHLISFLQVLFVALGAFVFDSKCRLFSKTPTIPLSNYLQLSVMFFVLSVLNNKALAFHISMPLHMIFRSASLVTTLLLGFIFFKNKYSMREVLGVILVTCGIFAATLADALYHGKIVLPSFSLASCCSFSSFSNSDTAFWNTVTEGIDLTWVIGVSMLAFALVLSSVLGHIQDQTYKIYGKNWQENLFYTHFLSLPLFVLLYGEMKQHWDAWLANPMTTIHLPHPFSNTVQCSIFLLVFVNVFSQYVCIRGVFCLLSASGALTTTITLTLRKFVSLLISVVYFQNPFTLLHWVGSILVFGGTAIYSLPSGTKQVQDVNATRKNQ
eukprot:TRINITY_DN1578_c0_g1_i1.p1 TRINITY_DN1578_c0_g1~~TRINITY_DN1578_c0_g1_i1.p1  ORF type:complete len:360 (-),score=46.60 TRINITY_DN1578_c0_g1_i1:84-1163(-)